MNPKDRIRELVDILNKASESYYAKDEEIMSNFEYDALYDELVKLEEETGIQFSDSPTKNVGYEAVDFLPKERHDKPMLSLGKTKSVDELAAFLNGKEGLLSWKLDGLTVVLTYENGKLSKAVTRGNGETGEVITANASTFINIPLKIAFTGKLVLRGEAVISYPDFDLINAGIDDADKYKNPRNLCSGSVRQLNSAITARRRVRLIAFNLVSAEGKDFSYKAEEFAFLKELGFEVVEYFSVTPETVGDTVLKFAEKIKTYEIPSDGLVLSFNDIEYGKSLGMTAKFPRDSIAFKWQDETAETVLREIEWSPSRTGLINPVAIFDTVELEGTSVSRASVHNISVMEELKLGIGDRISVYKANMIIPQIAENLTGSGNMPIPDKCPCCGGPTEVRVVKEAKALYCVSPDCPAKQIKRFAHFVSRDAMNVEGLSEATLEKFVDLGFIRDYPDIFKLSDHRPSIVTLEGFGEKSYNNLIESTEKAKETTLPRFIYALGIPNVGLANAKLIARHYNNDLDAIIKAEPADLSAIDGIGEIIGKSVSAFFLKEENLETVGKLRELLKFAEETIPTGDSLLSGKTVVVTGSLNLYNNRKDLRDEIEKRGGKVSGSVSKNTFVLVNNDINSNSSKNKTAKELGVPIVSEEEFVRRYINAD
ncbi:MAG: NAD-dependent DNA ligase LigA [Lachnospiraceae bacterium]|nr:NAD-dependent DNA ligase LigA [Lachnospiraceae bacterium]